MCNSSETYEDAFCLYVELQMYFFKAWVAIMSTKTSILSLWKKTSDSFYLRILYKWTRQAEK